MAKEETMETKECVLPDWSQKYEPPARVDQNSLGKSGNCFQASVASLYGLDIEGVPDFCNDSPEDEWFLRFKEWSFGRFGDWPIMLKAVVDGEWHNVARGFVLACGESPRGGIKHSVVAYVNNFGVGVVHDPHPSRAGILGIHDIIIVGRVIQ